MFEHLKIYLLKIFSNQLKQLPDDDKRECFEEILKINIFREKIIAKVLILLNIFLLCVDIGKFKKVWYKIPAYKYLMYSHIVLICALIIFLLLIYLQNKKETCINNNIYKILNSTFILFVLIWCVFISINSQIIHNQISAYIIGCFCVASFLILVPLKAFLYYVFTYIVFNIGLFINHLEYKEVSSIIINLLFVVVLSMTISKINFSLYIENFWNKKMILNKSSEDEKIKTEFFATVSHELRTPLNVIFSAEQMLSKLLISEEKLENRYKIKKYLRTIKQNSYRLIRLINNLIDITKMDAGHFDVNFKNYDIISLVEDITLSVAEYIENKKISLVFDTEIEEKIIACDPEKIERIMLNLLSNAVKFTDENGSILVNIYDNIDNIVISVKDTGIGIPKDEQDRIFKRYMQAHKSIVRNKEGSGIGLSLVKSLVEMHNGDIVLKSEYGKGSEFIVKLPAVTLVNKEKEKNAEYENDKNIEKINIEFSDIYF